MALFRALRHHKFALLLFAQTLSRLGDFVFDLALAWWVLEKTGSALAMGTMMIFTVIPSLIFGLAGGVAGDRFPRVKILLLSDFARAIVMAVITMLAINGQLALWMLFALNLLFSFADAFFQPAFAAILPEITPAEDLTSANALSSLSMQFGRIAGPALGGLFMAFGGTGFAFGFNAASFLISGLLVLPLLASTIPPQQVADEKPSATPSLRADIRAGLVIVAAQPILWVGILIYSLANVLLSGPFAIAMPFLVKNVLGGDERMLGLLLASFPLGYAISSIVVGNFSRFHNRGLLVFLALAVAGLSLAIYGLPMPIWVLLAAGLVNGAALELGNMVWTNTLQEIVPLDKMARVTSIDMLGSTILLPIGYAITGIAVEGWGAAPIFIVFCSINFLLSLLPLFSKQIRKFD